MKARGPCLAAPSDSRFRPRRTMHIPRLTLVMSLSVPVVRFSAITLNRIEPHTQEQKVMVRLVYQPHLASVKVQWLERYHG